MVSHAVLTMVIYALTMAYRDWEDNECYKKNPTDPLTTVSGVGSVKKLKSISTMLLFLWMNITVSSTWKSWPFFQELGSENLC
mgnify:CR=1 FL=1